MAVATLARVHADVDAWADAPADVPHGPRQVHGPRHAHDDADDVHVHDDDEHVHDAAADDAADAPKLLPAAAEVSPAWAHTLWPRRCVAPAAVPPLVPHEYHAAVAEAVACRNH